MKIAVTGSQGYLGTRIVDRLLADHHRVVAVDRPGSGNLLRRYDGSLRNVRADIRNSRTLRRALRHVDAVIHLAGIVGGPACSKDPSEAMSIATDGARSVMAAARGKPVVAISSDAVYSDAVRGEADEGSPVDPVSLYGESKLRLERIVEDCAGVILRFPSCFGPTRSMRDDLLVHSLLREHLAGTLVIQEPETTRSLLHVQDAASAVCSVLAHPTRTAGQTYNAASGSWTKRQIGQTLCKVFGGEITFEDAPRQDGTAKRDFTLNCGKLARATGWRPRLSILCGLIQLRALERARAQQRG